VNATIPASVSADRAPPAAAARVGDFRDPTVWLIALVVAVVHLAVATRYDFFRNEFYFIVCGRRPDFGYADQPPLVPLLAAATQLLGDNLFLLRLPAAIAAAALAPVTAAIAILLGGGRGAAIVAALAVSISPGLTAITSTLGTPTFEPVGWTLCAYFLLRGVIRDDPPSLLWAGLIAGISLEVKYGVAIWLVGLALGLLLTDARRVMATRMFWLAALLAAAIAAPSLVWQALHGWPFLEIVAYHSGEGRSFTGGPLQFLKTQALAMNIVLAPLWVAGIVTPYCIRALRPARILSVAFIVAAAATFAAHGKEYYLFPAYPTVLAAGAVAAAGLSRWLKGAWLALAVASFVPIVPIVLPILDPATLRSYIVRTHLAPAPDQRAAVGAPITQVFSDEFGWRELESAVTGIFRNLPASERATTGIFAWNYGEAAALDVFGRADGLPPAMSGENQYFLWGPASDDTRNLIVVAGRPAFWRKHCGSLDVAAPSGAPLAMPYERDRTILICHDLLSPLSQLWPSLKFSRAKLDGRAAAP
jgi:hypothetical protein